MSVTAILIVQYFQNPKDPREPVPAQLESIAEILLVPLVVTLHHNVEKVVCCSLSFSDLQTNYACFCSVVTGFVIPIQNTI